MLIDIKRLLKADRRLLAVKATRKNLKYCGALKLKGSFKNDKEEFH